MLQNCFEGVALALVDFSVGAWQRQLVVCQKFTTDACIMGGFLGWLVLSYAFITSLGM